MHQKQFWMVSGPGPSTMRHGLRKDAEAEAIHLAKQNPDVEYFVMEAISLHVRVDVQRTDLRGEGDCEPTFSHRRCDYDDNIPF